MNFGVLLRFLSLLPLLALFGRFLNEELLLAFASLLFFGLLFNGIRSLADQFFQSRQEEIYGSLLDLLSLRLSRLSLLLAFGQRLAALSLLLTLPTLSLCFLLLPATFDPLPSLRLTILRSLRRTLGALEGRELALEGAALLPLPLLLEASEEALRIHSQLS